MSKTRNLHLSVRPDIESLSPVMDKLILALISAFKTSILKCITLNFQCSLPPINSQICCEAAAVLDAVAAVDDVAAAVADEEVMAEKRWGGTKTTGEQCKKSSECRVGRCM